MFNIPLDRDLVQEELYEFGVSAEAVTSISMAVAEVIEEANRRNIGYVLSYCPRKDKRLTVDVLHYKAKEPKLTDKRYGLTLKIAGGLYIVKGFPHGGFTIRMVTAGPVMRKIEE